MKEDYSQAKIYKITNDVNNDIWIGSTCDTLIKKFSVHKMRDFIYDCKKCSAIFLSISKLKTI